MPAAASRAGLAMLAWTGTGFPAAVAIMSKNCWAVSGGAAGRCQTCPSASRRSARNQQSAGDVRQVVEGVRLVETSGPLRLLSGQDPPEHRLARSRAGPVRAVIVRNPPYHHPCLAVSVRGEQLGSHLDPDLAFAAARD